MLLIQAAANRTHGGATSSRSPLICLILLLASAPIAQGQLSEIGHMTIDASNEFCSPLVADIDGNSTTKEVILGDQQGNIYAFASDSSRMWKISVRAFPGHESIMSHCTNAPAVGDVDGDGLPEVVVGLGNRNEQADVAPGRLFIIDLDATGRNPQIKNVMAPQVHNNLNAIFNSPTLYDLNGDGLLDIMATSFNEILYARDYNLMDLWNLDYSPVRVDEGFIAGDTIWGAAVAADHDADGILEVYFGVDAFTKAGMQEIPFQIQQGGAIIGLKGNTGLVNHAASGKMMITHYAAENIPQGPDHIPVANPSQVIQGAPIIADVDGDGQLELIHGTGLPFFQTFDDDEHGKIYCWNLENATLAWSRSLRYSANDLDEIYATPTLGAPQADNSINIFVRTINTTPGSRLYGIKGTDGSILPGWPQDLTPGNGVSLSNAVADIDGDGDAEVLQVSYGNVHIFGSNGVLEDILGNQHDGRDLPNLMFTTPAVADLDGDGNVEVLLACGDGVHVFQGAGNGPAPWPQYLRNEKHQAVWLPRDSKITSSTLPATLRAGETGQARIAIHNPGSHTWDLVNYQLQLLPNGAVTGGVATALPTAVAWGDSLELVFDVPAALPTGEHWFEWQMVYTGPGGPLRFGDSAGTSITVAQFFAITGWTRPGTEIAFSGLGAATADGTGFYRFADVPAGWTGTATPSFPGLTFAPVQYSYTNVQTNIADQNFASGIGVGFNTERSTVNEEFGPTTGVTHQTTVTVSLQAVAAEVVTVDYAITSGTATGGGVDYTAPTPQTLVFGVGETSREIVLDIHDDAVVERNETIYLELVSSGIALVGQYPTHTITILSQDKLPNLAVRPRHWPYYR